RTGTRCGRPAARLCEGAAAVSAAAPHRGAFPQAPGAARAPAPGRLPGRPAAAGTPRTARRGADPAGGRAGNGGAARGCTCRRRRSSGSGRPPAPESGLPHMNTELDWLMNLQLFGMKPGLGRMEELLRRFGNPQQQLETVLIGGTNGKGSTASLLAAMLSAAGRRTGLFTSPHLTEITERF